MTASSPTPQVRCSILRGGTSKAVFLWSQDLPADPRERDAKILRIFGSPDPRQIDGLGGADPLTSKLAIIGVDAPEGCDLTYTFAQVGIDRAHVDYESLCGNITAAVGLFAVETGLCGSTEGDVATVSIYNTNLGAVLRAEVPVTNGRPQLSGGFAIPGVPGAGPRIRLDLAATGGAKTGSVLPTGQPLDVLDCVGVGLVEASLIDVGNPHVFVRAADFGLTGTETTAVLARETDLLRSLEVVRIAAARRMALASSDDDETATSPAIPILGLVGPAQSYCAENDDRLIAEQNHDLVGRLIFMQQPHKAFAATSTVCVGAASKIRGSVVAEVASPTSWESAVTRIGHPSGVIHTEAQVAGSGAFISVERATVDRTARHILDGVVYL